MTDQPLAVASLQSAAPAALVVFTPTGLVHTRALRIEWGDCDPAQIVFHPRFFAFFDASAHELFRAALGIPKTEWRRQHGVVGFPIVDTRARFIRPVAYGDDVTIESQVVAWRSSSFDIGHRLIKAGVLCVEATGTRVWAGEDPHTPGKLKGRPIPAAVISAFERG